MGSSLSFLGYPTFALCGCTALDSLLEGAGSYSQPFSGVGNVVPFSFSGFKSVLCRQKQVKPYSGAEFTLFQKFQRGLGWENLVLSFFQISA